NLRYGHVSVPRGPAPCHRIYQVEYLHRTEYGKDRHYRKNGDHRRHGYVLELLPRVRAVNLRRLVKFLRDRLKAGQEDNEAVTETFPHMHYRDRGKRGL